MKNHSSMLFNQEMVNALLSGDKTVMRINAETPDPLSLPDWHNDPSMIEQMCPFKLGELIWVRETFRYFDASDECGCSETPCGCPSTGTPLYKATHDTGENKWKPSVHMPKKASRMTLKVTSVGLEHVQQITTDQAFREGCQAPLYEWNENGVLTPPKGHTLTTSYPTAKHWFSSVWDKQHGNWHLDPVVWVVTFEVIQKNINDISE